MFDPSTIHWEFLKKEAKTLLKRCRAGNAEAIRRVRAQLPRLAKFDDPHVAIEIKLADIQHALAREHRYANFEHHLRNEADVVLRAAVDQLVASLPSLASQLVNTNAVMTLSSRSITSSAPFSDRMMH